MAWFIVIMWLAVKTVVLWFLNGQQSVLILLAATIAVFILGFYSLIVLGVLSFIVIGSCFVPRSLMRAILINRSLPKLVKGWIVNRLLPGNDA